MVTETDLTLADNRTLHYYDSGTGDRPVFWLHGTPQLGLLPEPLLDYPGIRWIGYDRPGYGASTPNPGRTVASAAADVAAIADELGIGTFAAMGASSGGIYALTCGALLPDRVDAVIAIASPAPFDAPGLDWFAGINPSGVAELRAATEGREALAQVLAETEFDPEIFTPADHEALNGEWAWLGRSAGRGMANGPGPFIDDDVATVNPWGFRVSQVTPRTLLMHGRQDRMVPSSHSEWLARHCPNAELRCYAEDGHVSVLRHSVAALDWLTRH